MTPIGGGRHGALHTAARLIARHGEDAVLPMGPGLGQRVRQQRQCAGLAVDVAHEQVDEPGSRRSPARVAGPVIAARTCASVIGPRRYRPSWTSPANDGSPLTAATKSARSVRTIGARTARRDNPSAKDGPLGLARA